MITRESSVGPGRSGDPNRAVTRLTLLLASSLTVMSGATIAPALPAMQAHFAGVENSDLLVRLVLTVPALAIVVGAPLAGVIGDLRGRARLLYMAILLYAAAGSSGLYLDSLGAILAGRVLLGAAVAGVLTSATALAADYYSGAERARFMGCLANAWMFAIVGGDQPQIGIETFSAWLLPKRPVSSAICRNITAPRRNLPAASTSTDPPSPT